jgi:hypothetical protein
MTDRKKPAATPRRDTRDERDAQAAARQRARERAAEEVLPSKSGAPKRSG